MPATTLTPAEAHAAQNLGDFIADVAAQLAQRNGVADPARYIDAATDYVFETLPQRDPQLFARLLKHAASN